MNDFRVWLRDEVIPWNVYCDPSASSWKQALRDAGYRVVNAKNDVINGIRHVGSMLNQRTYLIDSSCVNTIREYQTYVWDDKQQELGQDKPLKQNDHAVDTDRYALMSSDVRNTAGTTAVIRGNSYAYR